MQKFKRPSIIKTPINRIFTPKIKPKEKLRGGLRFIQQQLNMIKSNIKWMGLTRNIFWKITNKYLYLKNKESIVIKRIKKIKD